MIEPPYRRIISRQPEEFGEVVELECGHRFRLIVKNRTALPCTRCAPFAPEIAEPIEETWWERVKAWWRSHLAEYDSAGTLIRWRKRRGKVG